MLLFYGAGVTTCTPQADWGHPGDSGFDTLNLLQSVMEWPEYLGKPQVLNWMARNECAAFDRIWATVSQGERYLAFMAWLDAPVAGLMGLVPKNHTKLMGWNTINGGLPRQVLSR